MPTLHSTKILGDLRITGLTNLSDQLTSTVATGTAPFVVASTTAVTNLNADLLDGQHAAAFYLATNPAGYTTNTGTVTSVAAGVGMNFTTFTTSGTITMGTPSSLTDATTNSVSGTTHTHAITNYALSGTTNQITVTGAGKVLGASTTLSLPQNIHTTATPTFGRLSLSQAMTAGTTAAFTTPHLALVPTDTVDNTGFVGMTFATSTTADYGYSLGALRSTNGNGDIVIRNHFASATGVETFRLNATGRITLPSAGSLTTSTGALTISTSGGNGIISLEPNGTGVITHTKSLASKGATYTHNWMQFDEDVNGNALYLGSGALTVLGSGESVGAIRGQIGATTETLVFGSDESTTSTAFRFISSLQGGWAGRVEALAITGAGNATLAGSLTAVNTTLSGDIAVNGGDITSTATTFNLLNSAVTTLNIGSAGTTVNIPGSLTVTGTIKTNNVEMIETANGVIFEGTTADDFETTLKAIDPTADRLIELPNASGTVALTSELHTRSHAMTSTSDHTAGNWRVFHSNGSGQVAELALGVASTYLKANGVSAAPTFSQIAYSEISGTPTIPTGFTISAGATDGLFDITGTSGTNSVTYAVAPYAAKQATLQHFYTGTTNPTVTTRLNLDGALYATQLYDNGTRVLTAHPAVSAASSVNNSGRTYIQDITLDSFGHITGLVSATETVTDTHYTAANFIGATGTQTNAVTANGATYLKLVENATIRSSHLITGTGATTVVSDVNGNITINSTDTNTVPNNATLTLAASTGISLSATPTFTADASVDKTITITNSAPHQATNLTWTAGTTAGPVVNSSTGTGAAIPSASVSASGAVTTSTQVFAGAKTFRDSAAFDGITISGRAAGTGTWSTTFVPGTLSANNTLTLPITTGTVALTSDIPSVGNGTLSWAASTAGGTNTTIAASLSGAYSANTSDNRTMSLAIGPAISALATTMTGAGTGFLRKNGADTYSVDTTSYYHSGNLPPADPNWYPTAFAWTNGTTAGPTGSLTGVGMTAVSYAAIPAATGSISGIVTTTTQTFAGSKTFSDNAIFTGDIAVNGGDITTSSATLTIGNTATTAQTLNLGTAATATGVTKTLNIGTGGAAGSTTNINIGSSIAGTTTISSPTVSIPGNLTVAGNITVNNVEMINTSNGIIFEGSTNDDIETTLIAVNPTVGDQVYQLPNFAAAGTWTLSTTTGTETLTNKTLTAPRITSGSHIADSNGNELINFPTAVTSAVNELYVSNAATGNAVGISTTGNDTNIGLTITTKGTGTITIDTGTGAGHIDLKPGSDSLRLYDDNSSHYYRFLTGDRTANYDITLSANSGTMVLSDGAVTSGMVPTWNGTTGGLLADGYSVQDSTSNAALGTNAHLVTERDVYYGLVTVNNASQSRANSIYGPTAGGTAGQALRAVGATSAPTWETIADSSSAAAIGTGTTLVSERDVYYGLPTINNSHTYTSSTTLYGPTAGGTAGYTLVGAGTTSAPTWTDKFFIDTTNTRIGIGQIVPTSAIHVKQATPEVKLEAGATTDSGTMRYNTTTKSIEFIFA